MGAFSVLSRHLLEGLFPQLCLVLPKYTEAIYGLLRLGPQHPPAVFIFPLMVRGLDKPLGASTHFLQIGHNISRIYCTKVHEIFKRRRRFIGGLGTGTGFAIFPTVVKCQHKQ